MMRAVAAILLKDILRELRTKEILSGLLLFAVLVIVVFRVALEGAGMTPRDAVPGMMWITFSFAGMLGLARMFEAEKENHCLQGLMMAPVDRSAIFLGKLAALTLFMLLVELILLAVIALLYQLDLLACLHWLALTCLLGTLGFAALGVSLSAIAGNTRMRDVLLPILLFPLLIPLIVFAVQTTQLALAGAEWSRLQRYLGLMGFFDMVFLAGSFLLFGFVLED